MSEADEQAAVVEYLEYTRLPFYHIPNERKCSPQAGARLKKQGVKPGVPDLCIPVARGGYHALYIEMKTKGGRVTENQKEWLNKLREHGNFAVVCYGADSAIELISKYLSEQVRIVTPHQE